MRIDRFVKGNRDDDSLGDAVKGIAGLVIETLIWFAAMAFLVYALIEYALELFGVDGLLSRGEQHILGLCALVVIVWIPVNYYRSLSRSARDHSCEK